MIFDVHVHLCPDGCLDSIIGTKPNPSYQMAHNNPWEKHMEEAKKRGIVGSIIFPLPFSELTDKEKTITFWMYLVNIQNFMYHFAYF